MDSQEPQHLDEEKEIENGLDDEAIERVWFIYPYPPTPIFQCPKQRVLDQISHAVGSFALLHH